MEFLETVLKETKEPNLRKYSKAEFSDLSECLQRGLIDPDKRKEVVEEMAAAVKEGRVIQKKGDVFDYERSLWMYNQTGRLDSSSDMFSNRSQGRCKALHSFRYDEPDKASPDSARVVTPR